MKKLTITRGLPASGKTTLAREYVRDNENTVRVNRDDIRYNLYGIYHGPPIDERVVTLAQHGAIYNLLRNGVNVIVDDTNLHPYSLPTWEKLAKKCSAVLEVIDLTGVPMETCVARDEIRRHKGERGVGYEAIKNHYERYLKPQERVDVPETV